MSKATTAFCKNFTDLVKILGIPTIKLYNRRVPQTDGGNSGASRKAVESVLRQAAGYEPRPDTKQALVEIIQQLKPELGFLDVLALESADFNAREYLGAPGKRFNHDFMRRTIDHVIESSETRGELVRRLTSISLENAKAQFWPRLRGIVARLDIPNMAFNDALNAGGMPDGLPVAPNSTFLGYAKRILKNPGALPKHHQLIWRVVTTVYPPDRHESDPELKEAARFLAWFWNHSITRCQTGPWAISIVPEFADLYSSEAPLIHLLSWLELPLVLQTGVENLGKTGLFELGRLLQERHQAPGADRA